MAQAQRYRLKLSKLDFCSLVDNPAQPNAKTLLFKHAKGKRGEQVAGEAKLAKLNEELGLAFFWAFTSTNPDGSEHFDLHGDTIDQDFVKAAMDFMIDGGGVDEMHDEKTTSGRVVFAMPMTPDIAAAFGVVSKQSGLMIAIKPTADQLAKLKDGTYSGVSIGGAGYREVVKSTRVAKHSLVTDIVDGHQHEIHVHDDGSFWVSSATMEGSEQSHSHGVVVGEGGKLQILLDAGHSHELAEGQPGLVIVPADSVVVVSASLKSTQRKTPPIVKTNTETPMTTEHDKTIADLTAKLAKAERLATMTDAQRAHYTSLGTDGESYLAKSFSERQAAVVEIEKANEVVYTCKSSGEVFRKSDDKRLVAMAKRQDEQAEEIAKRDAAIEKAELVTLAKSTIGDIAGDDDVHLFIVKSIKKSGGTAEQIDSALTSLRSANAFAKSRSAAPGASTGEPVQGDALAELTKGLTTFCKAQSISKVWTDGLEAFAKTAEGAALKSLYTQSLAG